MTQRNRIATTLGVVGIAASLWGPTYWLAGKFGYHTSLGGVTVLGLPLYWPGQLLVWVGQWGHVYMSLFGTAALAMLVGLVLSLLVLRLGHINSN